MHIETVLITITLIIGLYMAWNIGANDVSNAIGTAVGSRALTLKKAIILAAILEFSGAFFLGSHVSSTIQRGIIKPEIFSADPIIFAIGMMGALFATGIWLNLASYFRLPVSTTHAIVGSVIGFGAVIGGIHALHWTKVTIIAFSWVLSPFLSGFISYILFNLLQQKILYTLNPISATKKLIPFLIFFAFSFFTFNLIFKGHGFLQLNLSFIHSFLIALLFGFIASLLSIYLLKKIPSISHPPKYKNLPQQSINLSKAVKHLQRTKLSSTGEVYEKTSKLLKELKQLSWSVKKEVELSETSIQYTNVEKIFAKLQIISICFVAFAHGSNDVANAVGPVAAVINALKNKVVINAFPISPYILLIGGIGIVIGLATWGWRVIETIGRKITQLTPTRGFSAEFSAAVTILFASKLGLPISTTHALVGAVLGVGLAKGINALNLKTVKDIVLSWAVTIPVCAILSVIVFYILKAFIQ
jgi:phosphate/sulfate permease